MLCKRLVLELLYNFTLITTNVVVRTIIHYTFNFFFNVKVLQKYGSKQNSKVCFYLTINIKAKLF